MRRLLTVLLLVVLVCVPATALWAQDDTGSADVPPFDDVTLSGDDSAAETPTITISAKAVAELAHAVSARLGQNGALPEWGRVATTGGTREQLSAADMFVVLTEAAQSWYENGSLPAQFTLRVGAVNPPLLDPEDYPQASVDLNTGRELSSDDFLSFASETLRWALQFHQVPTAVWVNGERLSAAEYLGGLAICLEYAYYSGGLEDTLVLPDYSPPLSWAEHTDLVAESGGGEGTEEGGGESAGLGVTPPLQNLRAAAAPPAAKPHITLLPASGATVKGTVDLVVDYRGPAAAFITFSLDGGQKRAIMNAAPYSYRWNTAGFAPGKHQVVVRAFVDDSVEVAAATATYVIAPATHVIPAPKPATPPAKPKQAPAPHTRKR